MSDRPSVSSKLVIVLERHNFIRGCLCSWIESFCKDYRLTSFPDVYSPQLPPMLGQAALAIFSTVALGRDDGWLAREICSLRTHRPDLPIIAIIDESEPHAVTEAALRLGLQGYIPTTSTLEVAAAVLHLVAAGGTYIPHLPEQPEASASLGSRANAKTAAVSEARLTPRERKVLDLLEQGMSNKMIAYRLSLSESTVKVHVHRILSKFRVHNRTEAVVAAYQLYARAGLPQPARDQAPETTARGRPFPLSKVDVRRRPDDGEVRMGAESAIAGRAVP